MALNSVDRWLALGLAAGLLSVLATAVQNPKSELASGIVARVGNAQILESEWRRAIDAAQSDRRAALTPQDTRAILNRLVDEELLVQHALASGLAQSAPRIRSQLVLEVMESMREERQADESQLRAWYLSNNYRYRLEPQWHLRIYRADGSPLPLPDALLPQRKLADYLPAELVAALSEWPVDTQTRQIRAYRVERLDHRPARIATFEQVRDQVHRDWQRDQDEIRVRQLLRDLRRDFEVTLRP